ncbi:MAG TPA: hypothetical protein VD913_00385 [bacterium]|nr:hypothetical protein [bacterium]
MNRREIDRFFRIFSRCYKGSCRILLTGAGAGTVMGRIRATMDLDFAVKLKIPPKKRKKKEAQWVQFAQCVRETTERTGIAVQYAEDIDRWSSITYLDYEKHTTPYKRFGNVEVRLLAPEYWAIGKLTRYLDPDIRDLTEVLFKNRVPWQRACRLWGKALRGSPKSTACELFRRQIENFLASRGKKIWGHHFKAQKAVAQFHRSANLTVFR